MKFNQLVDDAAEEFEVARAVKFADLAKQTQLQAQFSQLRNMMIIMITLTNSLLTAKNSPSAVLIGMT